MMDNQPNICTDKVNSDLSQSVVNKSNIQSRYKLTNLNIYKTPLIVIALLIASIIIIYFSSKLILNNNQIKNEEIYPTVKEEYIPPHQQHTTKLYLPELGHLEGSIDKTAWTGQKILQFLAIPYAESPSKERRFKAPVPLSKWNNVRNATTFGRPCPQLKYHLSAEYPNEDLEDCLHLSVYTKDVSKKRPVMVYIHGGGLKRDKSSDFPSNFLLEKDIVYVAIQYRLGALGFLSTRNKDIPGNMGLLDAILALEWIHKNIKHFGGDPSQVTIFGNSAGGYMCSLLAVSPKVRNGLFQRVIMQSGSFLMRKITEKNPIKKARNLCVHFGCKSCDKIEDIHNCMMQTSVEKLVNANVNQTIPFGFSEFDFEGVFPKPGRQLVEENKNSYQIMCGFTKHEGAYFVSPTDLDQSPRKYLDSLIKLLDEDNFSGVLGNSLIKLFFTADQLNRPKINLEEMIPSYVDIISIMAHKSPAQQFLELYMSNNPNKSENYLYAFDYAGEHRYMADVEDFPFYPFQNGVHHANELLYLFPWKKPLNAADTKMAKLMVELWTSFAITGKPQYENGIEIPKVKNPVGPYFHINTKIKIDNDISEEFFIAKREKEASGDL